MVPEKRFTFLPLFILFLIFFISIPNVNCFLDQFTEQFINVIATNNDLLTDELNMIYFAPLGPILWLYVIIWLPRTTDNSTYFAQSLEIRGIKSRLYFDDIGSVINQVKTVCVQEGFLSFASCLSPFNYL